MSVFLLGIMLGFVVGYAMGLFIDKLDKRERNKNGRR
jgi:NhaP-type Na+/H+ or K+/H+ antiporter